MAGRAWLMRIAGGEYEWPEPGGEGSAKTAAGGGGGEGEQRGELMGPTLALSAGARRIVDRLLVRDPRRRARIQDLWGDRWMGGEEGDGVRAPDVLDREHGGSGGGGGEEEAVVEGEEDVDHQEEEEEEEEEVPMNEEELELALQEAEEEVDDAEGWLVDQEGIGEIARR
ncbi:hypothetical protein H0H87_008447, partial [Tephrocybe sp. NHM501043]